MREATLIREDSCPRDVQTEAARLFSEAICGNDRMDEPRRNPRVTIDCGPIVGPRGGIRRYTTVIFRDDVCEDGDAEDAIIALLDGPGDEDDGRDDEDREENDFDDEEGEDDASMYAGGMPLDEYVDFLDRNVTVNGENVSVFVAKHPNLEFEVEADEVLISAYENAALDAECATEAEIERAARPCTCKGQKLYRQRNKRRNHHRTFKVVRCGGRGKAYFAKRHVGVPHNKPTGDSQRRETLTSRFGNASIRTQAFDRMADVDPWTVHASLQADEARAAEKQHAQLPDAHMEAFRTHLDEMQRSIDAMFVAVENRAFDVVASLIDFDTAAVAWREGQTLALQETIDRATTPRHNAAPDALTVYRSVGHACVQYLDWDGRGWNWSVYSLGGDWDDDLRQYERLAMAAGAERESSFFRRMSN